MTRMIGAVTAVVLAAFALPAAASSGAIATRTGNFKSSALVLTAVPLDQSGATTLIFYTYPNQPVWITYNAECGVLGPSPARVSIEILVDGVEADPASGDNFVFCTATSTNQYRWVGATRQSVIVTPQGGEHAVSVGAVGLGGATEWWLGDSSITVNE